MVQQIQQPLDHGQPNSGKAARERIRPQQYGGPHGLFRQRFTNSAAEKLEQILLVMGQLIIRNHIAGIAAEAGVHPVNHFFAFGELVFERLCGRG